jgi:hypothetical protein
MWLSHSFEPATPKASFRVAEPPPWPLGVVQPPPMAKVKKKKKRIKKKRKGDI